jgi:hypothetical protein
MTAQTLGQICQSDRVAISQIIPLLKNRDRFLAGVAEKALRNLGYKKEPG